MDTQILWFTTRGAGVVSLILFTIVLSLGIATAARWQSRRWPRFLTAELHRSLALLSLVFLGIHIVTAVVDPFTHLGFLAAVVPFESSYRPLWVGLGVLSIDLGAAVLLTSLVRSMIGQRTWRLIHWLAYGSWPLALAHSIGSGSDAAAPWMIAIDAVCAGAVAAAVVWRASVGRSNREELAIVAERAPRTGSARDVVESRAAAQSRAVARTRAAAQARAGTRARVATPGPGDPSATRDQRWSR